MVHIEALSPSHAALRNASLNFTRFVAHKPGAVLTNEPLGSKDPNNGVLGPTIPLMS